MHKLAEFNSNGIQHMHISRRLLHTTLYIQPPKLILTGRFVVRKKTSWPNGQNQKVQCKVTKSFLNENKRM